MRATVTQLDAGHLDTLWPALTAHTATHESDLVLLPEMPFFRWLAASATVDPAAWEAAIAAHDEWIGRLGELRTELVVGSRPVLDAGRRYNEGFLWIAGEVRPWHRKTYLPDEPGFWEASWYDRGPVRFATETTGHGNMGIQICTEMWFFEHTRDYARADTRLILTPRATEARTVSKWVAGGRVSAVSGGAYSLSSNHHGSYEGVAMGGSGWIISPDGELLASTSDSEPFVTLDLDLGLADRAKETYPRYVVTDPV